MKNNRVIPALDYIKEIVLSKSFSKLEIEILLNNLELLAIRLQKRDFKRYSYQENKFDVPQRTRDFFIDLEFYSLLGKTWEVLLKRLDVNKFNQVVDICPGYSPKIELGLFYVNYRGQVVLLDQDKGSLNLSEKFIRLFNPKFTVVKKQADIFNLKNISYKVVLANHVLDDLVLYYFSQKMGTPLKSIYQSEKQIEAIWKDILGNKAENMEEISAVLVDIFTELVASEGYLCIAQYKSYMERMLNLHDAAKFSRQLLSLISDKLERKGFVEEKNIVKEAFLNYKGHFGVNDCIVLKRIK